MMRIISIKVISNFILTVVLAFHAHLSGTLEVPNSTAIVLLPTHLGPSPLTLEFDEKLVNMVCRFQR